MEQANIVLNIFLNLHKSIRHNSLLSTRLPPAAQNENVFMKMIVYLSTSSLAYAYRKLAGPQKIIKEW